ncbi:hypothetical protein [Falsiroseomonas sp.]|uniref:hypothetical protein n=1 Tax=Falsiroseomonas sp. TaxID=2870721 RepID=UPI0027208322|nr:hypothetical protein [Falsiroseomonas sp.]MDO9500812.1 hypothetical protein [Falsiroseomonas sp.]
MSTPDQGLVEDAAWLAREVAEDLSSVLLTLYPDAETLDTLHPGETDLATANAVTRAVAAVMAEEGVDIFVQRADRGAFRRALAGRAETPVLRRAWVDRERLLRGADAWRALGLPAPPGAPAPEFPAAPGPVAEDLLVVYADRENGEFEGLVNDLLQCGRGDVLDLALRKMEDRHSAENAADLRADLLAIAGGAELGPSGWAELIALPVALSSTAPDALAIAEGLIASGGLAPSEQLRLLPGWRSPTDIEALSPLAMRRILTDLAEGREPRDLPPGDTDDLVRSGFGVLVGLRIDWNLAIWDEIAAAGGLPEEEEPEAEETPESRAQAKAIEAWRARVAAETGGSVPLDLVPLAETDDVIATFLDEAAGQVPGLDRIRDFLTEAEDQAEGAEVVCQPAITGEGLELAAYTAAGRPLGVLALQATDLPAPPEAMLGLIGGWVRLVEHPPRG